MRWILLQENPLVDEFGWNWYRCQGCGERLGFPIRDPLESDFHAERLREHLFCTMNEIDVVSGIIVS